MLWKYTDIGIFTKNGKIDVSSKVSQLEKELSQIFFHSSVIF